MKQAQFEALYRPGWQTLEQQLNALEKIKKTEHAPLDGFVENYRQLCHHLTLAKEHAYSLTLQQYLNALVHRAHRQLYRYEAPLLEKIALFLVRGFPQTLRQQWLWHTVSAVFFVLPLMFTWLLVQQQPDLIYTVLNEGNLTDIEAMYPAGEKDYSIRERDGSTDFGMFGYYIYNNVSIAFRTFAGGVLLGVGSLFVLLFNGSFFGAIAAHLIHTGGSEHFFTFVIAHGAPELTAIVLAGGAGLMMGWAILAPGQLSRAQALKQSALRALPTLYGCFFLLVLAAFIEAFWSPRDLEPAIKYGVGGACWLALYLYIFFGGRQHRTE